MNASQIHTTFKTALNFLAIGKLKNAFDTTMLLVDELQIGEYADKCNDLKQNYTYLLKYYIDGTDDPARKSIYNKLTANLFSLNCLLCEELLFRNSTNFEYTQKRYFPHRRHFSTANSLFDSLNYFHRQTALVNESDTVNVAELKRLRNNYESLLPEVFSVFWLTTHYSSEIKTVFNFIQEKEYPGNLEKTLAVSALTLNLWRMFDEQKLQLLFDCCDSENQMVKQRALIGLCFVLSRYNRFLQFFPSVRNRLELMADDSHTLENFRNILIQIIGTVETEKISKKLQEEILPEVMKISPMLKDRLDNENLMKSDEWEEENPEWQEMLEKSGVADKLQELTELQLEGADVYMSTFSMLKSFPFFNEISNWFLLFDPQFSSVNDLFSSDDKSVISAFMGNNAMCNSDKYSFCLSVMQMPEAQRGMLKQSFKMEAEQLEEIAKDEAMLTPDIVAKNLSKQYIQDLFRFFKLFPQKNDFSDMFGSALFMHQTHLFEVLTTNSNLKTSVSEYYFSKNHYEEAIELFEEMLHEKNTSAALYQKIGYAYQQISEIAKALDAYLKADMIQPDDLWTIRKIALCYRMLGNWEKALEFYQHANFLKPEQQSILLNIGQCLVQLGKFKDALNIYFKLDALTHENAKVWRAIAWCSFVSKNLSQAEYYADKLVETSPEAHDYLNAGHIAWCQRRLQDALDYYMVCLKMYQNNMEKFMENLSADKTFLLSNGIDPDEFPLMIDQIQFATE